MDLASYLGRIGIFISLSVDRPGRARPIRKPGGPDAGRTELKSVERGGGGGGKWRRVEKISSVAAELLNSALWLRLVRSHIPTSIPTQFCPRYYCLLADCRVGSRRRTVARGRVVAGCKLFHDSFRASSRPEFA